MCVLRIIFLPSLYSLSFWIYFSQMAGHLLSSSTNSSISSYIISYSYFLFSITIEFYIYFFIVFIVLWNDSSVLLVSSSILLKKSLRVKFLSLNFYFSIYCNFGSGYVKLVSIIIFEANNWIKFGIYIFLFSKKIGLIVSSIKRMVNQYNICTLLYIILKINSIYIPII